MPRADELLNAIAEHEKALEEMSAGFSVAINGKEAVEADWGFSHGREYIKGKYFQDSSGPADVRAPQLFEYAFDGQKLRHMSRHSAVDPKTHEIHFGAPAGSIGGRDTFTLVYITPKIMTGYDLSPLDRLSLSETLRNAQDARILPEMESVGDDRCYVIKATLPSSAITVWITPDRDYRLMKLECRRKPGRFLQGKVRYVVDNVRLKQIDGVWVPVEGDRISSGGVVEHLSVDPQSVSVGKPIPEEKFRINWPVGTVVHDDFMDGTYEVAEEGVEFTGRPTVSEWEAPEQKIPLRILYVGKTGSDRAEDFRRFLVNYFEQADVADAAEFQLEQASGHDVVILDCERADLLSGESRELPFANGYSMPTVLQGTQGAHIGSSLHLKTGYS
jgi:hypothetical protein